MIVGNLSDTASVEQLHPLLKEAFDWLRVHSASVHATGVSRVVLQENALWANVETPTMKDKNAQMLEVHRAFIDIHVPVDRAEVIGYLPTCRLREEREAYDEARDIAFYADAPMAYVTLHPGEFAIMTPQDAHAPIIGEGRISKICVKVRL